MTINRRNIIEQIKKNLPRLNTEFISDLVNRIISETSISKLVDLNSSDGYDVITCLVYKILFNKLLEIVDNTKLSTLKNADDNTSLKNVLLILESDAWDSFFHKEWWDEDTHYIKYDNDDSKPLEIHDVYHNELSWKQACDSHNGQTFGHLVEWIVTRIGELDAYLIPIFGDEIKDWKFKI